MILKQQEMQYDKNNSVERIGFTIPQADSISKFNVNWMFTRKPKIKTHKRKIK